MAARDILKNINLFIDGRGYAGQVQEVTPPVPTQVTEDFRAGGMNGPVKITMGMEPMEASFVLSAYDRDVLALFGVVEGGQINCTIRGALESYNGTVTPVAHVMRGKVVSLDSGTWKPGELSPMTVNLALNYWRLEHGIVVAQEVDIENMIHRQNGIDLLAPIRAALGL